MVWPLIVFIAASGVLVVLVLYLEKLTWWADHADVVIGRAKLVERLIVEKEARLRAYIVTRNGEFLAAYDEANGLLSSAMADLQEFVADNPRQTMILAGVRADVGRWDEYANAQLGRLHDNAPISTLAPYVREGATLASETRARLQEFIRDGEELKAHRTARATTATKFALSVALIMALLLGPALALTTARQMRRAGWKYQEALEVQERTAHALRESEGKLRMAKDAAKMGAWNWDLISGEMVWSDRCKALFGLSPDTVMSDTVFLAAVHPEDRDRIDRAVKDALTKKEPYEIEMRVPRPDGTVAWVAFKGEVFHAPDGRAVRLAGMVMDITERKRAEELARDANEKLRETDRRKDEFLGMLSHELRNPLAPIRNSVHVLGRVDPASPQAARARTIISRQVDHLARLVDDLLDVKRISTGKLRLHTAVMDLTKQVRETVEDIRPLFVNRTLTLDLKVPDQAVWVDGDSTRLAQVVSNLLHNAAKFTDVGGHVSVSVESADGEASIRVRDDGVGVPPDMLDKLFDPFIQSDRTLHRTTGGLGLGLSLVRGITELHGGAVVARSGGIGKGTEFVVTLPTTEPASAASAETLSPGTSAKSRVLIIEDNVDAAESLRDLIEILGGHEVRVAHDGEEGIAAARERAPDVILCDIGLPVIDGYEVARRMRANGIAPGARLVALSGYASAEDIDRAIRAGFDFHVAKPAAIDKVLALVANAPSCATCPPVPDDIATGHHEVDAQHASLLAELERLRTVGPESVRKSLRLVKQHMVSHFGYEETLMEEVDYPDLAAHKQRHGDGLRRLRVLQEQLEREGATSEKLSVLADAIQVWVAEHVFDEDRRLAEFIRDQARADDAGIPTRSTDPGRPTPRLRLVGPF